MPPDVSVIIPTNRSPAVLAPCLRALAAQTVPHDRYEVLVMNDGARHDLSALAAESSAGGLQVRVLDVPPGGPGRARNRGAEAARGELLVFTDDDCVPEAAWLATFLEAFRAHPKALLGGHVTNLLPRRAGAEASQVLVDFLYAWYNRDPLDARFFTSNNIAARRAEFLALGGFDETFTLNAGEDRDLCARWRESGGRLVSVPAARIGHAHDLTLPRFWRQHVRYGHGAARYWQARRQVTGSGLTVEPPGFYAALLAYPLRHRPWPRAFVTLGLVVLSQVANAVGFAVAAGRLPGLARARGTGRGR